MKAVTMVAMLVCSAPAWAGCNWVLWVDIRTSTEEQRLAYLHQAPVDPHLTREACLEAKAEAVSLSAWVAAQLEKLPDERIAKVWVGDNSIRITYKPGTRKSVHSGPEATVRETNESFQCWPSDFDLREKR